MKKIVSIVLMANILQMAGMDQQAEDKKKERIERAEELSLDAFAYAKADLLTNGHLPFQKRLNNWKLETMNLSGEERQELLEPVREKVYQARKYGLDRHAFTLRQITHFTWGLECILCDVSGWDESACRALLMNNEALIKKHKQELAKELK